MLAALVLDALIDRLEEDLAGGDLTTEELASRLPAHATAKVIARKPLVACGGDVFLRVFQRLDRQVEGEVLVADGMPSAPAPCCGRCVAARARSSARSAPRSTSRSG